MRSKETSHPINHLIPRMIVYDQTNFSLYSTPLCRMSPTSFLRLREDAAEDDPMRIMVRRDGPAGFPQLFVLDPDRNIIEINGAP
jgi:hypothetical protein